MLIFFIQCVIGKDDVAMVIVVRAAGMLKWITEQTHKLEEVNLITSNFQKKDGHILTSNQSTINLNEEVIV